MRAIPLLFLAVSLVLGGCKSDPSKPEHWSKSLDGARKSKDRVRILEDLRESKRATGPFLPMLHERLASEKQPEVKAAFARVLGDARDPSSVQPLIDALDLGAGDSATNSMNKDITSALGEIGDAKAIPTLMKLTRVKDNYTRIEAINALGQLKAKEAVEPLIDIATDDSGEPFLSKKAIQALGEIGDPRAVPALVKMMFKERRGVSFYVESSYALYQIGQPAADLLVPIVVGQDLKMVVWA
jgi:HEAT repeat protein